MANILTHYWGSHFKSDRQVANMELQYEVLVDRGWNCHLVLERVPDAADWLSGLRKLGVKISYLPRPRGNFDLSSTMAIRRLCLDTHCNVFHCDNMHMSPLIGAALAGVPVRIWCKQSMNSHYEQCLVPSWRERLALSTRLSALLATRVIAVSNAVGAEVTDLGIARTKVFVLNYPRPEIKPSGASREETRRRLKIPDDSLVFVNIGRAEKVKGWDVLLKAFAKVAEMDSRSHLFLVGSKVVRGDTSFMDVLDNLIKRLGLAQRVSFTGHVTDVKEFLQAADIFVLPSRSEGCCLALLEALELSLPCVATRVGNATEIIQNGGAGILVSRDDPDELATALLSLVNDDGKRAEMASHARIPDHMPSRHSHAQIIAELYASLASANAVPHSM
ncbi:MAG: glycosyltransferase [Verrucomicrobiota bacterium]